MVEGHALLQMAGISPIQAQWFCARMEITIQDRVVDYCQTVGILEYSKGLA
jgi:hypothetical protein